jgi:hypothetical protein
VDRGAQMIGGRPIERMRTKTASGFRREAQKNSPSLWLSALRSGRKVAVTPDGSWNDRTTAEGSV